MIPANMPVRRMITDVGVSRVSRNLSIVRLTPTSESINDKAQTPNNNTPMSVQ